MNLRSTIVFLLLLPIGAAKAQTQVIPPAYASTDANATFLGPLANSARAFQMLIDASLLTNLVGTQITGFTFRSTTTTTAIWPPVDAVYTNYDIYLGPAIAIPSTTTTLASNEASAPSLVRAGTLTIPTGSYPAGGPNSWGPVITFTTPYLYSGGNLAITIRHTGSSTTSRSVNSASTSAAGYGTLYKAAWSSGYTSTGGMQGNFPALQLSYSTTTPVVLKTFDAVIRDNDVAIAWITGSEKNLDHFAIERSVDGTKFNRVEKITPAGGEEIEHTYEFIDMRAMNNTQSGLYYRLRTVEKDGKEAVSRTVFVSRKKAGNIAYLTPNPAKDNATLHLTLNQDDNLSVSVIDLSGKNVLTTSYAGRKGDNNINLSIANLAAGTYMVNITGSGFSQFDKIVIQ